MSEWIYCGVLCSVYYQHPGLRQIYTKRQSAAQKNNRLLLSDPSWLHRLWSCSTVHVSEPAPSISAKTGRLWKQAACHKPPDVSDSCLSHSPPQGLIEAFLKQESPCSMDCAEIFLLAQTWTYLWLKGHVFRSPQRSGWTRKLGQHNKYTEEDRQRPTHKILTADPSLECRSGLRGQTDTFSLRPGTYSLNPETFSLN